MRYIATFTPQAWVRDNAIEVDPEGPTQWNCTEELLKLKPEAREQIIRLGRDRALLAKSV